MRPVSPGFIRSLSGSHKMRVRARVCEFFQTGVNPIGTEVEVIDGTVTLDGKAAVRSALDLVVEGTRKWPIFQNSLYAPYGNELYVERGIELSDDNVEYVGLGYHRIESPEQSIPTDNPIRITAVDRMQAVIEARLLKPRQFVVGDTFGFIVDNLITEVYPGAIIEWDDNTHAATLTRSVIVDEDRYSFLNDAITSRGKIWYWDHRGILIIKDVPPIDSPVYTVKHAAGGNLVAMQRALTRAGTFNAVVALGEGPDTNEPVRGVAIDNDPLSPTYFYGRFGQVPRFYSSPFLSTEGQCLAAAQSILNRELGLPYTVNLGTIVNPALEPFDAVHIKYSHFEAPQVHVLDVVPIPLTEGAIMQMNTREQRLTLAVSQ